METKLEIEGLDESPSDGWDDYPLDAVFVRNENRTVAEVVRRINAGRYQLDPDFQRDFVWDSKKQSRLIESCLMRIPLPVIYVAEMRNGTIAVVDGLQRLTTFANYLGDKFPLMLDLPDGSSFAALKGARFSDLPLKFRERIEDTQLTLYILDAAAPERAKLDIFERVNNGVPLTRQQMRNCLFNGPATQWLKAAANSQEFLTVTGGTLSAKAMRDREAINRFCAFMLFGEESYRGDMDAFLARALEKMKEQEVDLSNLLKKFEQSMQLNFLLFGEHAFRRSLASHVFGKNVSRSILNISLFDVFSVLFAQYSFSSIAAKQDGVRRAISSLLSNSEFSSAITYSTNSTRQIQTRFGLARNALSGALV